MPEIELTADEIRNGWTPETLKAYLDEREKAQSAEILDRPLPKPRWANGRYNPLKFGR